MINEMDDIIHIKVLYNVIGQSPLFKLHCKLLEKDETLTNWSYTDKYKLSNK